MNSRIYTYVNLDLPVIDAYNLLCALDVKREELRDMAVVALAIQIIRGEVEL